jgi:hypothetical protein
MGNKLDSGILRGEEIKILMAKLRRSSYDDTPVRNFIVNFCLEQWGIKLKSNDELYKIDLLGIDDPLLGVEVEHGKWKNNFWQDDSYSLISGQKCRTVNIPARKEKYWLENFVVRKKEYNNPSHDKNIFMRTNKDFSQIIVIRPETIKNPKKLIRTKFQPKNSNEVEKWLSFRREDVETYNLVKGKYILDKIETQNLIKQLWNTITHLLK